MNNCYQCIYHHMKKGTNLEVHSCSEHKEVKVFGQMGNEPIVENCGCFVRLKEYYKSSVTPNER